MVLNFSPTPEFYICATKVFEENELHVTRIYNKSVLILMMDGELRFKEDGKEMSLKRGEYYIQRDGLLHQPLPIRETPVYFYIEFFGSFGEGDGLPIYGRFDPKNIVPLLESCEELFTSRNVNPFLLNSYMMRIFSELLAVSPKRDENPHFVSLVRKYLSANYYSSLSLSDIAEKFGYTEDYIIRAFRKKYGKTPHKYLTDIRMERARWMLENTDLNATETAQSVGYNDFSSFYRAFRQAYGVSPSKIKKLVIE